MFVFLLWTCSGQPPPRWTCQEFTYPNPTQFPRSINSLQTKTRQFNRPSHLSINGTLDWYWGLWFISSIQDNKLNSADQWAWYGMVRCLLNFKHSQWLEVNNLRSILDKIIATHFTQSGKINIHFPRTIGAWNLKLCS